MKVKGEIVTSNLDHTVLVTPNMKLEYTLEELLKKVTKNNIHGETDTGFSVGSEAWQYSKTQEYQLQIRF